MLLAILLSGFHAFAAENFRVATYNLENYLDQPTESRHFVKSAEAKTKIREGIRALNPDVLALARDGHDQRCCSNCARRSKAEGLDFPYWGACRRRGHEHPRRRVEQIPHPSRGNPHTNDNFLLDGKRFRVGRGFAEVDIQARTNFGFTLIAGHLKSRRPVPEADETELRLQEAKVLRGIIDEHFKADPNVKLIVLGDFNDVKSSDSTKAVIGRGKFKLTDTRPSERNGDNAPNANPRYDPRTVAWTYHYGLDDTYARIDYILLSPARARDWVTVNETYALAIASELGRRLRITDQSWRRFKVTK